jgi:uncharacterized protein YoxC
MVTSTQDILNLSLAIGFALLVIFLCVALVFLILVLRDVSKITSKTRETVDTVSGYILVPAKALSKLGGKIETIAEIIQKKVEKEYKKRKK